MSLAIGPIGRNGEATGSINSSGKMAAMSVELLACIFLTTDLAHPTFYRYSYSKTRGLFGGVSVEGSVIVERQDANSLAYKSDVTAKQLLSGSISPPEWAHNLIKTLESCTGMPGTREWINDGNTGFHAGYAFGGGVASPGNEPSSSKSRKKKRAQSTHFPPPSWGQRKESGSYFESEFSDDLRSSTPGSKPWNSYGERDSFPTSTFDTHFESDFSPNVPKTRSNPHTGNSYPRDSSLVDDAFAPSSPFDSLPPPDFTQSQFPPKSTGHSRSVSAAPPLSQKTLSSRNPFAPGEAGGSVASHQRSLSLAQPYIATKPELAVPLLPQDGVARAIALYNFQAVEVRALLYILCNKDQSTTWMTGWRSIVLQRRGHHRHAEKR